MLIKDYSKCFKKGVDVTSVFKMHLEEMFKRSVISPRLFTWILRRLVLRKITCLSFKQINEAKYKKCFFKKIHLKMSSENYRPFCLWFQCVFSARVVEYCGGALNTVEKRTKDSLWVICNYFVINIDIWLTVCPWALSWESKEITDDFLNKNRCVLIKVP